MPPVVRHLVGAAYGLFVTLLTWIGLGWAIQVYSHSYAAYFGVHPSASVLFAIVLMLIAGVGLGFAASARFLSPLAALVPGAVFFLLGTAIMLLPGATRFLTDISPAGSGVTTFSLSIQGIYSVLGLLLIVSGVQPHRWRAAPRPPRRYADYVRTGPPPGGVPPGGAPPFGPPPGAPAGPPPGAPPQAGPPPGGPGTA